MGNLILGMFIGLFISFTTVSFTVEHFIKEVNKQPTDTKQPEPTE